MISFKLKMLLRLQEKRFLIFWQIESNKVHKIFVRICFICARRDLGFLDKQEINTFSWRNTIQRHKFPKESHNVLRLYIKTKRQCRV